MLYPLSYWGGVRRERLNTRTDYRIGSENCMCPCQGRFSGGHRGRLWLWVEAS